MINLILFQKGESEAMLSALFFLFFPYDKDIARKAL